jgi:hypothetical protein
MRTIDKFCPVISELTFIENVDTAEQLKKSAAEQAYGARFCGDSILGTLALFDMAFLLPKNSETFPEILEDVYQYGRDMAFTEGNSILTDYRIGMTDMLEERQDFLSFSTLLYAENEYRLREPDLKIDPAWLNSKEKHRADDYNHILTGQTQSDAEMMRTTLDAQRVYAKSLMKPGQYGAFTDKGPAHVMMWGLTRTLLSVIRRECYYFGVPLMVIKSASGEGANKQRESEILCSLDISEEEFPNVRIPLTRSLSDPRALFNLLQISSMYHYGKPAYDLEQTRALLPGITNLMQNGRKPLSGDKKTFDSSPQPA